MSELFKGAVFGIKYKTASGEKAIYIKHYQQTYPVYGGGSKSNEKRSEHLLLIEESTIFIHVDDNGKTCNAGFCNDNNIVSKWEDDKVDEYIQILRDVKDGWDGERGLKPCEDSIKTAEYLLRLIDPDKLSEFSVFPANDGSVYIRSKETCFNVMGGCWTGVTKECEESNG